MIGLRGVMTARDGTVFVSQWGLSNKILTLSADETTTTLAGDEEGFQDGRGAAARFNGPHDIAEGPDGQIYVADDYNRAIRRINRDGDVTTVAGRPERNDAEVVDGDFAAARFNDPSSVAVGTDGTIYVGEDEGRCVRQIRGHEVTTLHRCEGGVNGLLLDEEKGLLWVSFDHGILTILVGTLAEQREARYYPALRTWALVQDEEERAHIIPASGAESAQEARARHALHLLMDCPIADILVRTLVYLY